MSTATKIPKENEHLIGKAICESAKRYFENSEHRRAFEKWYLANYGTPYKWERRIGNYG